MTSPFDGESDAAAETAAPPTSTIGPLALTLDNVEIVLDEMRPYLVADGGNVAVRGIDDGIIQLELQGACGSCPSSTMTLKMGLERGLKEKIPDVIEVVQVAPEGPVLDEEGVEGVLEEIRPFLKMAGGAVELVSLEAGGLQPTAKLSITGNGATINSVRVEIAQRLKRNVRKRTHECACPYTFPAAHISATLCCPAQFPTLANVVWD